MPFLPAPLATMAAASVIVGAQGVSGGTAPPHDRQWRTYLPRRNRQVSSIEPRIAQNRRPSLAMPPSTGPWALYRIRICVVAVRIDLAAILLIDVLAHAVSLIRLTSSCAISFGVSPSSRPTAAAASALLSTLCLPWNTQLCGEFLSGLAARRSKTVIYHIKCTACCAGAHEIAGGI